jgi:RND superfamily putative drug exporter
MQQRKGLAARVGWWSVHHRKTAVFGWLAFVVAAFVIGTMVVGNDQLKTADAGVGDSGTAAKILDSQFPHRAAEQVLVHSSTLRVTDAAFTKTINDVASRVEATGLVERVQTPGTATTGNLVSQDGHSALVQFEMRGDSTKAMDHVGPVIKAVADARAAHPGLEIVQFGEATSGKAINDSVNHDFQKAEQLSLPLTLLILFLAFGALVAASVPVVLAFSAVLATFGISALASHIFPMEQTASVLIMLIGMAVGVDYALFYLRREREERAAGRSHDEAIEIAAATSGRAVLISGMTVMVASSGLFLTGVAGDRSSAIAMITVVGVAVVASLTILPAMMAMLGGKVERGRIPLIGRRKRGTENRLWSFIIDRSLSRPVLWGGLAAALLVALAVPALHMTARSSGVADLPKDLPAAKAYKQISKAFPGSSMPAYVVVRSDNVTSPQMQESIQLLESQALATGKLHQPIDVSVNPQHTVAVVSLSLTGNGADASSYAAVRDLRERIIPATVETIPGAQAWVTGETATNQDWKNLMGSKTPLVFAFVLGLAFLLLLVTFRSIVVPIKAIILNLLSVGAAYGLVVTIFQNGHGASLIGADRAGYVVAWLPLFLFVILFGLSMDYHVFILSRVREAVDRGMRTEDAVRTGIKATASTVSAAAIVMVFVFGIFATLSFVDFKEIGVGLAAAILIDATIIRGVLLPASMKLLGERNWYLPSWLEWLPEFRHEGPIEAHPERGHGHGPVVPAPAGGAA